MNLNPGRAPRALAALAMTAATVVVPTTHAGAQTCSDVVSSARAQSTVSRGDASSGAALSAPAYYSQLIFDSIPSVAYNQSGPSTTGQLEDPTGTNPQTLIPTAFGFMPVDPPTEDPEPFPDGTPFIPAPPVVGRSEAAFPTIEGIGPDSENRAATSESEAHAGPTYSSGRASGGGVPGTRTATAYTSSVLECETLTLVVAWEATGVVTDGGTIPSMSQIATLVITPDGATVNVATNVAEETEEGSPIIDGRPAQPIFDPFNEEGTFVDVGEPRVEVGDGFARVSGGGVRYGSNDPERNDTYTFATMGSLEGEVRFIAELDPYVQPLVESPEVTLPPVLSSGPVAPARQQRTTTVVEQVGSAPEPSPIAQQLATSQVQLAGLTQDLTTGSLSLWPFVLGLVALVLITQIGWRTADRGRDHFPTAGFAVDWFRARGRQFSSNYLQW